MHVSFRPPLLHAAAVSALLLHFLFAALDVFLFRAAPPKFLLSTTGADVVLAFYWQGFTLCLVFIF
jgi:hypothetical protein